MLRALVLSLVLGLTSVATAQDTGGSFGGSDWSSGGGGGSTDFGGGGGTTDWNTGPGSDLGSGAPAGEARAAPFLCVGVFFCVFMSFMLITLLALPTMFLAKAGAFGFKPRGKGSRVWNGVDVTAVRLGLDWRARASVQERLDELARTGRTQSKEGLVELLHETVRLVERARVAWLYADVVNHHPMSQTQARGIFEGLALGARARFQQELVRNADGTTQRREAGDRRPRSHEGPGVVVVTVVVAARTELLDVADDRDAAEVGQLLASLRTARSADLVALEVVWSPADPNDRMSTAELEARYPELRKLDERSIGGRVFCAFCAGPFADELGQCPHCGAPHELRAAR